MLSGSFSCLNLTGTVSKVVGPIPAGAFTAPDFHSLASYERVKRIQPIQEALDDVLSSDPERLVDVDAQDNTRLTCSGCQGLLRIRCSQRSRPSSWLTSNPTPEWRVLQLPAAGHMSSSILRTRTSHR